MAIEVQVLVQIADSDSDSILFKAERITCAIAPEGTDVADCVAIAAAKLSTTVSEAEADIIEQIKEATKGLD